jgi:arginine deiminase
MVALLAVSYALRAFPYTQINENSQVHTVMLHEPSIEVFMSTLHPAGSLYQGVTNLPAVLKEYRELRDFLESQNITTVTVKEALLKDKTKLKKLAFESLWYEKDRASPPDDQYLNDKYKQSVIDQLTDDQLFDIIITQPTIILASNSINTGVVIETIKFNPLGNLVFCRDQQITTRKGIVQSHMNSIQRQGETVVMKAAWDNIGAPIVGAITGSGRLEGGDYIPAKSDLSMLGVGLRTNLEAAYYMLENDLFGHNRVALIIDENDKNQDRMHLDTYFNIVSRTEVVLENFTTIPDSHGKDLRRKVQLYVKQSSPSDHGNYKLVTQDTLYFEDFLKSEGYNIIPITHDEQMDYMINFLNLGDNSIVTVNENLEKKLRDHGSQVRVKYVEFKAVRQMYGACHCATQAFRKDEDKPHRRERGSGNEDL